eukprot:m.119316 g.119316  ORF g.119316 m.119316 type:complete len:167 (-) comp11012_c0_seq8:1306-1806(-)
MRITSPRWQGVGLAASPAPTPPSSDPPTCVYAEGAPTDMPAPAVTESPAHAATDVRERAVWQNVQDKRPQALDPNWDAWAENAAVFGLSAALGGAAAMIFRRYKRITMQGIPHELGDLQAEGESLAWQALGIATAITATAAGAVYVHECTSLPQHTGATCQAMPSY